MPAGERDRRRHHRVSLKLPVCVRGRDRDGSVFDELAACEDASSGGVSLHLRNRVRQGQLLHLSLPLPPRFRQFNPTDHSYRVYALARSLMQSGGEGARVGLLFYGKTPPRGQEALSANLFLMPGDADSAGLRPHKGVPLRLRLAAEDAPGGREQEEQALGECVRAWDARVRISSLPAMKAAIVWVENAGEGFRTRAEVRHLMIGADGNPRLDLVFLDASAPSRLLTDAESDGGVSSPPDSALK
jgi:PilZ domain-containing protein